MFSSAEQLYYCKICDVKLSGPVPAKQHYDSQKHKKKEDQSNITDDLAKLQLAGESSEEHFEMLDDTQGQCKICNVIFTSSQLAKQHLSGKKHQKAITVIEARRFFPAANLPPAKPVPQFLQKPCCPSSLCSYPQPAPEQPVITSKASLVQGLSAGRSNTAISSGSTLSSASGVPPREFPLSSLVPFEIDLKEDSMLSLNLSNISLSKPGLFLPNHGSMEVSSGNQSLGDASTSFHDYSINKEILALNQGNGTIKELMHECTICNKRMNTAEELKLHQECPAHIRKASQQSCFISINNKNHLEDSNAIWFDCHYCKKHLNSTKSLRVHLMDVHELTDGMVSVYLSNARREMAELTQSQFSSGSGSVQRKFGIVEENGHARVSLEPSKSEPVYQPIHSIFDCSQFNRGNKDGIKVMECSSTVIEHRQHESMNQETEDTNSSALLVKAFPSDCKENYSSIVTAERNASLLTPVPVDAISQSCGSVSCMFHCNICKICLNSESQRKDHENGVQHWKKLKHPSHQLDSRNAKFYCELCDSPMNTQKDFDQHVNGQQHMINATKKLRAPERNLEPIVKTVTPEASNLDCCKLTASKPRLYQIELYKKAMMTDTVCFLPTGTGKTLVSIMVMSHLLHLNPHRSVVFLVDKILLVLQQSEAIEKELSDKVYSRWNQSTGTLEQRKLRIAQLCGGKQSLNQHEVWQQDIVVMTAAYYYNLLELGSLRWTDNCLVVFDEVHHCAKHHPYHQIMETVRQNHKDQTQHPKLFGLTASPAGKNTINGTISMLEGLLSSLGDVRLITVQGLEEVAELQKFQSNTELVVREMNHTMQEVALGCALRCYIIRCWLRLLELTQISISEELISTFGNIKEKNTGNHCHFLNSDVAMQLCDTLDKHSGIRSGIENVEVEFLLVHVRDLCQAIISLETFGIAASFEELAIMLDNNYFRGFCGANELSLPCQELERMVRSFQSSHKNGESLTGMEDIDEEERDEGLQRIVNQLEEEIIESLNRNKDTDKPLALILVRRRKDAQLLTQILQKSKVLQKKQMMVTYVVGHGAGKDGMAVNKQEKTLCDIRQLKYQVIVATSVAEEGLDFPLCELVVQLNPPDTVRALVQIRGRARKKGSRFVAFCQTAEQKQNFDELRQQEEHMTAAVSQIIGFPSNTITGQ